MEELIGGNDPNAERLWVLMGNDYPAAIWRGTEGRANARLQLVKDAQKAKDGLRSGCRIYWRLYPFQVETLDIAPDSVKAAAQMTGLNEATLTQLMHGWATAVPVTATHQHQGRKTFYMKVADAKLQTSKPLDDDAPLVVYIGCEDGQWWARAADEFNDGRFVPADEEE